MQPISLNGQGMVTRKRDKNKKGETAYSFSLQVLGGEVYCGCTEQQYQAVENGMIVTVRGGLKFFQGEMGFDLHQIVPAGDGTLAPPANQGLAPPQRRAA